MNWERKRFLIVVKTYPNPSASLQEVVCTAAVDENGELVRLYPIPFRTLAEAARFKKWQWIEASVVKADNDPRRESYRVDATSIAPGEYLPPGKGWSSRWERVAHLVRPSLEAVQDDRGASLGLIKPAEYSITFEDHEEPAWTRDELEKLTGAPGAADLFGAKSAPGNLLEKIPVRIRYKYRCDDARCTGHEQLFEDWEVGESWRAWAARYPDLSVRKAAIIERYADIPRAKDNLFLFVGTHSRHPVWLVIGHVQPAHLARKTPKDE